MYFGSGSVVAAANVLLVVAFVVLALLAIAAIVWEAPLIAVLVAIAVIGKGALAAALGAGLPAEALRGLTVHLHGELGAGKTTLVRGLLRGLGHPGRVKSPSYALVEPYALSKLNLYHFDFYRFKDQSEWLSSGFREHFNPESLCVVEWPERAGELLPPPGGPRR